MLRLLCLVSACFTCVLRVCAWIAQPFVLRGLYLDGVGSAAKLYAAPSQPNPSCVLELSFRSCVIVCVHSLLYVYIDALVYVVVQLRSITRSAFGGFIFIFFPCALRVLCSSALGALASSFCRRTCVCCVRGVPLERRRSAYPIRKVSARACGLGSFRVSCSSRWSICPTPPHYTRENMPGGMALWARVSRHDQCLPPPPPIFVLLSVLCVWSGSRYQCH